MSHYGKKKKILQVQHGCLCYWQRYDAVKQDPEMLLHESA